MTDLDSTSDIAAHLDYLREAARGRVVIELGVRTGVSTAAFLSTAAMVYSCDIDLPRVPQAWHTLDQWRFTLGSSTAPRTLERMPHVCDVLFIDTSHEYDQTLLELAAYWPRVKPGGVALLHDTCWDTLDPETNGGRWCRELDTPDGPVTRAIEAFCTAKGLRWLNRPGSFGLGVIRKPGLVSCGDEKCTGHQSTSQAC